MSYLEQMILGACYGEENIHRLSFLEHSDFTVKIYGKLFHEIKKHGTMIDAVLNNHNLKDAMIAYSTLMGTLHPERLGLRLMEARFKTLLGVLLLKLSEDSNNALEVAILDEAITKIKTADIFDLSDYLLEYLGHQASPNTTNRINAFLRYRNERIATAKKVIDEFR